MKLCALLTILAVSSLLAVAELPPPERSYKVLMLLPISSKSHRNVFLPIAKALADRGHKITMLSDHPTPIDYPNIHEFSAGLDDFNPDSINVFDSRKEVSGVFKIFAEILPLFVRKVYQVPSIRELYERRKEFDLVVVNHMFNEAMYPFVHEMPFVTVATPGMDYRQSAVLGNVLNPAYAPSLLKEFESPMNVFQRLANLFIHIVFALYWRNWAIVPPLQKEINKIFPDLPPVLEIERNTSLTLINHHYSMDITYPLLPNQIPVAGMHCKPGKPLPEDLVKWIEGAEHGVIYFSLGSITKETFMPTKYRDLFIQAFARMKQRVIWKYEEKLEGLSENVLLKKWLPQQDILAHPNVKVFITHGGLLSSQETMYHGTPVLVLPIFGDQPKNAARMQASGFGLSLVWEELTLDLIVDSLNEIIQNPKYKKNLEAAASVILDQKESPTERAVWWTEYVIRHRGAPALRCPGADLTWIKYLCLDVLAFIHVAIFAGFWIIRKLLNRIFWSENKKQKKE